MSGQRDLTGATVYRSDAYPGARWYVLADGEVVLERPSGERDDTIMSAENLASAAARPSPVWYLDSSATSEAPAQPPADQG